VELKPVIPAKAGIQIEVVYAGPGEPVTTALEVAPGTTLRQAIERCHPGLDLQRMGIGVFGRARGLGEPVAAGDRVEIYRPLLVDPKDARRRRAKRL
jgi:uncharacterized protein